LESILLKLQHGQRSSRPRWRRTWQRWRDVIRKSAMGVGAVSLCVMAGVAITYWSMSPRQTLTSKVEPSAAFAEAPQPKPWPIITLPPDTFEQDLAETERLLDSIESHWSNTPDNSAGSDFASDKWSDELLEVQRLLN
jgi:hypothetical protein